MNYIYINYFKMDVIMIIMDYSLILNSNMFSLIMLMKNENIKSLNMIYNNPNNLITFMMINYLFLTLIAVVNMTNINYGPLRQKF